MKYIIKGTDKRHNYYIERQASSKEDAYIVFNAMIKCIGNGCYVSITNTTKGVVIAEATKINLRGGC